MLRTLSAYNSSTDFFTPPDEEVPPLPAYTHIKKTKPLADVQNRSETPAVFWNGMDQPSSSMPCSCSLERLCLSLSFLLFCRRCSGSPSSPTRRVVIMGAAVLFLGEEMNANKLIGACIAVAGTLAYSLAKNSAAAAKKAKTA